MIEPLAHFPAHVEISVPRGSQAGARIGAHVIVRAGAGGALAGDLLSPRALAIRSGKPPTIPDQSALRGVLNRIDDLGLCIISVRRID